MSHHKKGTEVSTVLQNKLQTIQDKCDDKKVLGVLRNPEDVSTTVEYLIPSFLVSKSNGGHRLVTALENVGRYSKPQSSLVSDMNSTLHVSIQW